MRHRFIPLFAAALCALPLCGQAAAQDPPAASAADRTGGPASALIGVDWKLTSVTFNGAASSMAPDTPVTIRFDDKGNVSGRAPVNRFFGGYKAGAAGALAWSDSGFGTTRMAGSPDQMERENLFLQILGQVTSYRISGSTLVLQAADSNSTLTFSK